jgi:hypothetical protein
LLRQFGQAKLLMQSLWKLHGTFKIGHWSWINTTKLKKWIQYPSITIPKSFMGDIFPYLYIYLKTLLHFNIGMFFIFYFFVLGFGGKGGFCCKCNLTCAWALSTIYSSPCTKSCKSYNKVLHQYGHSSSSSEE